VKEVVGLALLEIAGLQRDEEETAPLELVGIEEPIHERGMRVPSGLLVLRVLATEEHGSILRDEARRYRAGPDRCCDRRPAHRGEPKTIVRPGNASRSTRSGSYYLVRMSTGLISLNLGGDVALWRGFGGAPANAAPGRKRLAIPDGGVEALGGAMT
jgi:hypothetical protein